MVLHFRWITLPKGGGVMRLFVFFSLVLGFSGAAFAQPRYRVTELAPPLLASRQHQTIAVSINDSGLIVGRSGRDHWGTATKWFEGGFAHPLLSFLRRPVPNVFSVNNQGVVVGSYDPRGFVATSSELVWLQSLEPMPSNYPTRPRASNGDGIVVGAAGFHQGVQG